MKSTGRFAAISLLMGTLCGCGGAELRDLIAHVVAARTATLAGRSGEPGSDDGNGETARFKDPRGIAAFESALFVADTGNNFIRQIDLPTGVVTGVAGSAMNFGSADGSAGSARFNHPEGVAVCDADLYIADTANSTIRRIDLRTGTVSTAAGAAGFMGTADGIGNAARFNRPCGLTSDGSFLYIADTGNHTIRRMALGTRDVSTLAGAPEDPAPMTALGLVRTSMLPAD